MQEAPLTEIAQISIATLGTITAALIGFHAAIETVAISRGLKYSEGTKMMLAMAKGQLFQMRQNMREAKRRREFQKRMRK